MESLDLGNTMAVTVTPPLMTVERFAEMVGLPVGVCRAQADRRLWPIAFVGRRRFINVEQLRKEILEGKFNK